ncbi:n-acetylglutamate synthase [Winogradskyella maritima]|uniref:N-acetylglutamate synthase n=1 Tax=Winogradskyella maritima TaxID=1517766 RepID=A0ABV8AFI3_9FLAO|nr:n-acetylglutamate synthase [Winogradskyella maritima]
MIHYHNRIFKPVSTSSNAEVTEDTIFHYKQTEDRVQCSYKSKAILEGHLLGTVDEHGVITMVYHQINTKGELMTGRCTSTPEVMSNGKIRIHESWQWTSGDLSEGTSVLEEI